MFTFASRTLLASSVVFFASLLGGCATESDTATGEDDLATRPVVVDADGKNIPANLREARKAIGTLQTKGGLCTAAHIGNKVILTAGHCLTESFRDDGVGRPYAYESETRGTIFRIRAQMNIEGASLDFPVLGFKTKARIVDAELSLESDYGILIADEEPPAALNVRYDQQAKVGDKITILSYPAGWVEKEGGGITMGQPNLVWSQTCEYLDAKGYNEPFNMVDVKAPERFAHQCATSSGSSGAPVLDAKTGEVIGIFNGFLESYHEGRVDGVNYGMNANYAPIKQYVENLPLPKFTHQLLADGKAVEDSFKYTTPGEKIEIKVADPSNEIANVTYRLYEKYDARFVEKSLDKGPFTATFETKKMQETYGWVLVTVTGKNGASAVFTERFSKPR